MKIYNLKNLHEPFPELLYENRDVFRSFMKPQYILIHRAIQVQFTLILVLLVLSEPSYIYLKGSLAVVNNIKFGTLSVNSFSYFQ